MPMLPCLRLTYLAECPGPTCTGVNANSLKWVRRLPLLFLLPLQLLRLIPLQLLLPPQRPAVMRYNSRSTKHGCSLRLDLLAQGHGVAGTIIAQKLGQQLHASHPHFRALWQLLDQIRGHRLAFDARRAF